MNDKPEFTESERREIAALSMQGGVVRGLQIFIIGLGAYLAVFEGRGWPSFVIGCGLALWIQTKLPILPAWLERLRPRDK